MNSTKPCYINVKNVQGNITKKYCCRKCLCYIKYSYTVNGMCESCWDYHWGNPVNIIISEDDIKETN